MIPPTLIWYGIITGLIIALGGLGATITFGILHFPNLAHGDYMIFSAYIFYFSLAILGLDIFSSSIIAICSSVVLGLAAHKALFSSEKSRATLTILGFGLSFGLREIIRLFFRSDIRRFPIPVGWPIEIFGIKITMNQLYTVTISLISIFILHIILKNTKTGKAMRALSDNPELAMVSGIEVESMIVKVWVLAMVYAALGGILIGMEYGFIYPDLAPLFLAPIYAAVVVGGIGNPYGALIGSLITGLSMEISSAFIPATYKVAVAFFILFLFLLVKPEGIMGVRRRY